MKNNLQTAAGRSKGARSQKLSEQQKLALVDAINQVFTLFRLNYHNQYLKAFGSSEELAEVKRLWLEMLKRFEPHSVLSAAKAVIESSEYLPTLRTMIYHCERCTDAQSFPEVHAAYLEACRAPSPKAEFAWSHPAVYHAGRRCDWYFLQSSAETVAYPIFRKVYEQVCQEIRDGEQLSAPQSERSEDTAPSPPLSKTDKQARLQSLKATLEL